MGEPRAVGQRGIVAEGVVVVEPSVAVGDGEFEVVGKDGFTREVLKHDADNVGILFEVDRLAVGTRGGCVGELDAGDHAVVEVGDFLGDFALGVAVEVAVEVLWRGGSGFAVGDVEVG